MWALAVFGRSRITVPRLPFHTPSLSTFFVSTAPVLASTHTTSRDSFRLIPSRFRVLARERRLRMEHGFTRLMIDGRVSVRAAGPRHDPGYNSRGAEIRVDPNG